MNGWRTRLKVDHWRVHGRLHVLTGGYVGNSETSHEIPSRGTRLDRPVPPCPRTRDETTRDGANQAFITKYVAQFAGIGRDRQVGMLESLTGSR